ncbi:MAG TPA: MaoC/PaaZ C-terminal domain-containing protein [Kofleriaceae bacterium]|nr:MaoC/PaaZ C-terminal domain-containing protein [Kofleriaceae bacterium]
MTIRLDLVGAPLDSVRHAYTWRDTVLYALGVGARIGEVEYLYEGRGPKVLPTFAVIPSFRAIGQVVGALGVPPLSILHGEQTIRLTRAIPPRGELMTTTEVTGIYDKGKNALVVVVARTTDGSGAPLFENEFSLIVRGAGGFGGERGPEARAAEPPERAADFVEVQATTPEQAALYRLSGDLNPLHIAPEAAKLGGFDRPILHGLCTYGFAGRALIQRACGADPARLRSFAARFSGVVFPGDTLTTSGWQITPGQWVLQVATQEDKVVLSHATAEVDG